MADNWQGRPKEAVNWKKNSLDLIDLISHAATVLSAIIALLLRPGSFVGPWEPIFIKLNTSLLSTFTESHVTFTDSQSSLPTTPPHTQIRTGRTITCGSYLTLGHYANPLQRVQAKPVRRACIAKTDAWRRQALDALVVGIRGKKVNWLVDANICGYL